MSAEHKSKRVWCLVLIRSNIESVGHRKCAGGNLFDWWLVVCLWQTLPSSQSRGILVKLGGRRRRVEKNAWGTEGFWVGQGLPQWGGTWLKGQHSDSVSLCVTPCDTKPHYVLPRYHYGSCHGFDGSHVCHHGYPHRLWGGQPHKCGWHPMAIVPWSSVHSQPLMLCVTSDHLTSPSPFLSLQSLSNANLPDNHGDTDLLLRFLGCLDGQVS